MKTKPTKIPMSISASLALRLHNMFNGKQQEIEVDVKHLNLVKFIKDVQRFAPLKGTM